MASPLDFITKADGIHEIHNAKERPQLWQAMDSPDHPLNVAWPLFLDQDATFSRYYPKLVEYDELARHQYAITETNSASNLSVVACARSVPFYSPGFSPLDGTGGSNHEVLQKLPQGGYDTMLARGVRQYLTRHNLPGASIALTQDQEANFWACHSHNQPNALSAISITVRPDHRRRGLAEALIQTMKQTAIHQQLDLLVVPLRPTRKVDFPNVSMDEYLAWPNPKGCGPFDPWLRKHVQLGAQVIKVASTSMVVSGSVAESRKWTKMDIKQLLQRICPQDVSLESRTNKLYVEILFPGGLVPLRCYFQEGRCVYTEPNVWLLHDLRF